ncbi:MAG: hypothetical protein QOE36_175 [Gaiellaceae bacterium]|jgi:hypothetical protein|nr:hypothetical protein [Gaiellaceae bacterium]
MRSKVFLGAGAAVVTALIVSLVIGVSVAGAGRNTAARLLCQAKAVKYSVSYCGPATARLSIFPGVTFRNGSCRRSPGLLSVGLGSRTQDVSTNGGKAYLGLILSGSPSHATGGVIVYSKSKRWAGRGVSFKGNARGGTFVVQGINGSHGTATGRFRC